MTLYVVSILCLAGVVLMLFAVEGVFGLPPRIHEWMAPLASPAVALAGCFIGLPVALLLLLPFRSNDAAQDLVWGGVYSSVVVATGFLTARWWQPIYLASVTGALFLVGGLFAGNTDDTVSDVVELALQVTLAVGALTALGALLRLTWVWLARRDTTSTTDNGWPNWQH